MTVIYGIFSGYIDLIFNLPLVPSARNAADLIFDYNRNGVVCRKVLDTGSKQLLKFLQRTPFSSASTNRISARLVHLNTDRLID